MKNYNLCHDTVRGQDIIISRLKDEIKTLKQGVGTLKEEIRQLSQECEELKETVKYFRLTHH